MLYGLPIPILPTQPKRWNQHSLLKRIPSDSLFEEFALALSSSGFIDRHRDDTKTRASPLDAICRPLDDAVLRKFGDVLSDI
jgi:hypothetical protein